MGALSTSIPLMRFLVKILLVQDFSRAHLDEATQAKQSGAAK
jgi:hypothetical protein